MRKVLFIHLVLGLLVSLDKFILTDGCRNDQFECNNTLCINITLRCNNNFDCHDYSDELNCDTIGVCPEGLYKCDSGQCVNALVLCDGINNCADGTDEKNCGGTTLYNAVSESSSNHYSAFLTSTTYTSKNTPPTVSTTPYSVRPQETFSSSLASPINTFAERSVTSSTTTLLTTPKYNYIPVERGDNGIIIGASLGGFALMVIVVAIVILVCKKIKTKKQENQHRFHPENYNDTYLTAI